MAQLKASVERILENSEQVAAACKDDGRAEDIRKLIGDVRRGLEALSAAATPEAKNSSADSLRGMLYNLDQKVKDAIIDEISEAFM